MLSHFAACAALKGDPAPPASLGFGFRTGGLLAYRCVHPFLFAVLLIVGSARADDSLPALVQRVKPAVATVFSYDDDVHRQGSGFFIEKDRLVTNYHVLAGAKRAEVELNTGEKVQINNVLAMDADRDLILVEVAANPNIIPAELANDLPQIAERLLVIGTPAGLAFSASDGIVSSIRTIEDGIQVIQITAPISAGSSGSPVFNLQGHVIGVASFKRIDGESLNFAYPIAYVKDLVPFANPVPLSKWKTENPAKKPEDESAIPADKILEIRLPILGKMLGNPPEFLRKTKIFSRDGDDEVKRRQLARIMGVDQDKVDRLKHPFYANTSGPPYIIGFNVTYGRITHAEIYFRRLSEATLDHYLRLINKAIKSNLVCFEDRASGTGRAEDLSIHVKGQSTHKYAKYASIEFEIDRVDWYLKNNRVAPTIADAMSRGQLAIGMTMEQSLVVHPKKWIRQMLPESDESFWTVELIRRDAHGEMVVRFGGNVAYFERGKIVQITTR